MPYLCDWLVPRLGEPAVWAARPGCPGDEPASDLLRDHLIRTQQQRRRDGEAEGLGGLEVDDEIELHSRPRRRLEFLASLKSHEITAPDRAALHDGSIHTDIRSVL